MSEERYVPEGTERVKLCKEAAKEFEAKWKEHCKDCKKKGRDPKARPFENMDRVVSSISGVPESDLQRSYKIEVEE